MNRFAVLVFDPQRRVGDGILTPPTADREKAQRQAASIEWAANRLGLDVTTVVLPVTSGHTGVRQLAVLAAGKEEVTP
jgi:hypothetical protein